MTNISTFPGDTQGRNILKSRTITHGNSSSGEVDTYTLNPGENLIILNNHQGSAGSSRTYAANFTAGIPTALGTVLHLEINSSRTNNSGSQVLHRTAIQFGGTAYLDTGNIAVYPTGNAQDAYQRKLQRTIVLTVNGWVDFSLGSRVGGDSVATDIIFKINENVGQAATGTDLADVERMRLTNLGLNLVGAGKDFTFQHDAAISRQSAANRDAFYSGLENSIQRVGDRNVFDGSAHTPSNTHEILMGFSDTYTQWQSNDQYYPTYNEMRFKLWTPTSSTSGSMREVLTLRNDGDVGVGTTNPTLKIDCFVGSSAYEGIQVRSSTNNAFAKLIANAAVGGHNSIVRDGDLGIVFSPDNAPGAAVANKGFYIAPWGAGTSGLRIDDNGNVGIATNAPSQKLHVGGLPVRFGGVVFRSGGGGTPNQAHDTGINMNGYGAGGAVLFFFLFHNSSGNNTRTNMYVMRKVYNGAWASNGTTVHELVNLRGGGSQSGTVTFGTTGTSLTMSYNQGGQQGWYALDFE